MFEFNEEEIEFIPSKKLCSLESIHRGDCEDVSLRPPVHFEAGREDEMALRRAILAKLQGDPRR
jgi:hypothetical protein